MSDSIQVAGRCPGCGHPVSLVVDRPALLACPGCATVFPIAGPGVEVEPVVVVGHGDETVLACARRVLQEAGMEPVVAAEAEALLAAVETHSPAAVLVDVMLPGGLVHDLIPAVRDAGRPDMAVLLLTTVHNAGAYKRRPKTLYGADDFVQVTDIEASMVGKLVPLLTREGPTA